ncbi:MAG TPA: deoxyribonuclease IV [Gemmatimonadales bacterium]|nr:deoxyribonuclease IV [Gemmatimonadales bacterium]
MPKRASHTDLLGAHVSTAGGVATAPARGVAIGATALQLFTKTPNQWREPEISAETAEAYRAELKKSGIRSVVSHDSYLINLASPDEVLRARSMTSFMAELTRCNRLGVPAVVSHPGNFLDDHDAGIKRNAAAITSCLERVPGPVMVLLETTAGTGTALGRTFEELAEIRAQIPAPHQDRIAFCVDTCHLFAAGYDLIHDYDGVWEAWGRILGFDLLRCVHLNDSKTPMGARRDRHELIAEGTLGAEPFRRIMRDSRFDGIPKLLETPKGDDMVTNDRRMLRRLRAYGRVRSEK